MCAVLSRSAPLGRCGQSDDSIAMKRIGRSSVGLQVKSISNPLGDQRKELLGPRHGSHPGKLSSSQELEAPEDKNTPNQNHCKT